MTDPKPFASLSSSLLARKGHAAPAMRRQAIQNSDRVAHNLEDLGWNDMGQEQYTAEPIAFPGIDPEAEIHAVAPQVHEQQDNLARELGAQPEQEELPEFVPSYTSSGLTPMEGHAPKITKRAVPGSRGKSAFTLRLDSDRHLHLRLVCAMKHRSAQQIVTEALDNFLARQPEVADLKHRTR